MRRVGLPLAVLLVLAVSAAAADKVTVTVLAIKASDVKAPIDAKLKDLAKQLKGAVSFKSLQLLSEKSRSGPYGKKQSFSLPEKMVLTVTPLEKPEDRIRLRVLLQRPKPNAPADAKKQTVVNMKITLPSKQGFPIVGPKLSDGGRLVLVISAAE